MYTERDLQLYEYNDTVITLLHSATRQKIVKALKVWFSSAQLRPARPDSSYYIYNDMKPKLQKNEIIHRITTIDWPEGLFACQIAQLHAQDILIESKKEWRGIRMTNDNKNIKLHLERDVIKTRLEETLSRLCHCYIYSFYHAGTDTFVFILALASKEEDENDISQYKYSHVIYFPGTEYIVTPKYVCGREWDKNFQESLLSTFGASKLISETADAISLVELKIKVDKIKSRGILGKLRNNELDKTPLDIRQKRRMGFEDTYVDKGEQKKRIVPIDMEEMKAQYQALEDNFDSDKVDGFKSLEVDLALPLNIGAEPALEDYDDDIIEIKMLIQGDNVADGIRITIAEGKIEAPAPLWLEGIAVTGAQKIAVDVDGVSEIKEDEEEAQIPNNE